MDTPAETDYQRLDDPEFLAARAQLRRQFEQTPDDPEITAEYELMTDEFDRRARSAWDRQQRPSGTAAIQGLPSAVARMLAVEILLTDPEALQDDVFESCLYLYREKLRAG